MCCWGQCLDKHPVTAGCKICSLARNCSFDQSAAVCNLATLRGQESKREKRADTSVDFILCHCDNLKLGAEL